MDWLILRHTEICSNWEPEVKLLFESQSQFDQHNVVFKSIKLCYPCRERGGRHRFKGTMLWSCYSNLV